MQTREEFLRNYLGACTGFNPDEFRDVTQREANEDGIVIEYSLKRDDGFIGLSDIYTTVLPWRLLDFKMPMFTNTEVKGFCEH